MNRRKRWLLLALVNIFTLAAAQAQYVTLTGTIQGSNGVVADNYTLSFTPNQWFYVADTAVVISTTTNCATSVDGSVVGIGNPLQMIVATPAYSGGTLPPGNYYVEYSFYTPTSTETLLSPETTVQLTSTGQLNVNSPAGGIPSGATGMRVYIGASSGSETFQGSTTGAATYVQSVPLSSGSTGPPSNTTICQQIANDAGWPTGTGYKVALADSSGNVIPGYPMLWQLLGPNTTINLSNGLPYYHGVVTFPSPILASPYNHNAQSISGPLSMQGYNIVNVGRIGIGTALPAFELDVHGYINSYKGYLYQGNGGTSGQCLVSNGTVFVPGSCGTLPTIYYQHAEANGSILPQEPYLNFGSTLAAADNPGSTRTDVNLPATGVTPGSYTASNITVDAFGRVTAAANGTANHQIGLIGITSGICTTADTSYSTCTSGPYTWPTAFADANYLVQCSLGPPISTTGGSTVGTLVYYIDSQSASQFTLLLQNGSGNGAGANTTSYINCTGIHP